ncbi:response regulator [Novispirillum itersonii]|uniref:response regulator n=1 Tax=Novispirillum itersonii TaxID=189 RepID=UPI00036435E8|nr:response regulator transcription factor [Novispirillum itersonii]
MRVLIADDHGLFRAGLKRVLQDLTEDLTVLEACSFDEAVTRLEEGVDIVLLDLVMPGMPWNDCLCLLKSRHPEIPVVILSASDDRKLVLEAVSLGASGFIPKTSSAQVMLSAVRLVLSGGVYLPPEVLGAQHASAIARTAPAANRPVPQTPEDVLSTLTPRQRQVLALIGQGRSNKDIAFTLGLAEGTVKLHVTSILKALKVTNRTGAVVAASRLGVTPDDPV